MRRRSVSTEFVHVDEIIIHPICLTAELAAVDHISTHAADVPWCQLCAWHK